MSLLKEKTCKNVKVRSINLKKLKYFSVVAQELNFKRAAEKLYVDQSSISRAVQWLESRLGVSLFERNLRRLKLTAHENMLLQEANHILYLADSINHRMKSSNKKHAYTIELAISPNIDGYRVAELLRVYRELYPQMRLNIHEVAYQDILSGIKQGLYNFALSLHTPSHHYDSLVLKKLWQERLIILLSKEHPLKSLQVITFDDLRRHPVISFLPNTLLYEQVHTASFTPRETIFVKSYSVLQALMMAHFGVSLVTESMLKNMQNEHIITRPIDPNLLIDTYLIYQLGKNSYQQIENIEKIVNTLFISG